MPTAKEDAFSDFEPLLVGRPLTSPWDAKGQYKPEYDLLEQLLAIPIAREASQASGRFAKAIDAWIAHELRRAGFEDYEVWPRATRPRILPRPIHDLQSRTRKSVSEGIGAYMADKAPVEARVLGEFFTKQVDVLIADWDRGAELIVSTKSQLSSYWNNLRNRYEESVGDLRNLRGRFPLAALGSLYLVKANIFAEAGAWEFAQDMLRKLRSEDGYEATCLLVADWTAKKASVTVMNSRIPSDLAADQFLATLVRTVLDRTPVQFHVEVRSRAPGEPAPAAIPQRERPT